MCIVAIIQVYWFVEKISSARAQVVGQIRRRANQTSAANDGANERQVDKRSVLAYCLLASTPCRLYIMQGRQRQTLFHLMHMQVLALLVYNNVYIPNQTVKTQAY
jgi:predicted nucleic acid-binding Zn ribbon protein